MKYLVILIVSVTFYLFSCDQDEAAQYEILTFGDCTNMFTDSLSVRTNLVGTWTLTEIYCPCCQNAKPVKPGKHVTATFEADGSCTVTENLIVITEGNWELTKTYIGFSITVDNQTSYNYLGGYISICDNQFMADASPVDGCKHLFKKVD